MIRIRFQRHGKKHEPAFRMVAMEARSKRDGQVREFLGFYNPVSKETKIVKERIEYWLSQGAKPSDTVRYLLIKQGVIKQPDKKEKKVYHKKPGKKKLGKQAKVSEKPIETAGEREEIKKIVEVEEKEKEIKSGQEVKEKFAKNKK